MSLFGLSYLIRRVCFISVAVLPWMVPLAADGTAACLTVEYHKGGWTTEDNIGGTAPPNSTITIKWKTFQGTDVQLTTTANAQGNWSIKVPDGGTYGTVTVTATGCTGSVTYKTAAALNPGVNQADTALAVLPGSSSSVSGATFNMTGSILLVATNVDYDSSSPTYGNLSGYILASALNLSGTGPPGTLRLAVDGNQPWTVSMLSAWEATNASGDSISFSIPVTGTASLSSASTNAITTSFEGSASGAALYSETSDFEQMTLMLNFNSSFGQITGTILASGSTYVTYALTAAVIFPNSIVISWPSDATNTAFSLQATTSLSPPNWVNITNVPVVVGDQLQVTLPMANGAQFLQLAEPAPTAPPVTSE